MKKIQFNHAAFIKSAVTEKQFPKLFDLSGRPMIEIAFVGRSNVGKSSLINHLLRCGKMAKISSTPGKTQTINFFTVDDRIAIVDLPGYGFAKVAKQIRYSWGTMIPTYLEHRQDLKLVLFLFDIRRIPQEEDLMLMDAILKYDLDVLLILTKVDKITPQQRKINTKKIIDLFEMENLPFVLYSTTKNIGRGETIRLICDRLGAMNDSPSNNPH